MVQPIKRPAIQWYIDQFDSICLEHERLVDDAAAITTNLGRIDAFYPDAQKFVEDCIHLTEESMRIFIESTLSASETIFENAHTPGEEEFSAMDTSSSRGMNSASKSVEVRVTDLENQLLELKNQMSEKPLVTI
jgi:hypothetical protein